MRRNALTRPSSRARERRCELISVSEKQKPRLDGCGALLAARSEAVSVNRHGPAGAREPCSVDRRDEQGGHSRDLRHAGAVVSAYSNGAGLCERRSEYASVQNRFAAPRYDDNTTGRVGSKRVRSMGHVRLGLLCSLCAVQPVCCESIGRDRLTLSTIQPTLTPAAAWPPKSPSGRGFGSRKLAVCMPLRLGGAQDFVQNGRGVSPGGQGQVEHQSMGLRPCP